MVKESTEKGVFKLRNRRLYASLEKKVSSDVSSHVSSWCKLLRGIWEDTHIITLLGILSRQQSLVSWP